MYSDKVKEYYDYTLVFYRLFWHGDTRALHYGIWDDSTKNLHEALINTNKFLAEEAGIKYSDRVLDAGCGVGGSAFWLAKNKEAHVIGITISEKQLLKAKELSKRLGLENKTEFYLQDFTKTSFQDESFDVVWAIESVCHALDKKDFLKEAYRLLKIGGRLILADGFLEKDPKNDREKIKIDNFLKGLALDNLARPDTFEISMKEVGFKNIKNIDKTDAVLLSSIKIIRMSRWSWILSLILKQFHLVPQLLVDNNRAGIDQLYLFKNKIITYRVFLAYK